MHQRCLKFPCKKRRRGERVKFLEPIKNAVIRYLWADLAKSKHLLGTISDFKQETSIKGESPVKLPYSFTLVSQIDSCDALLGRLAKASRA